MQAKLKEDVHTVIVDFIREKLKSSGASGIALNVSGGIDSALTLRLCVDAAGPSRVHALFLPDRMETGQDEKDAMAFASSVGVPLRRIYIGELVREMVEKAGVDDRKSIGNIKARTRMILVYALANSKGLIVAGTSNKSEFLAGYYTKFGDGASDFCPIGDLYKTEVRALSAALGLPENFLSKKPSAGLWEGQSDEEEMGITYAELDRILYSLEHGTPRESIAAATGIDEQKVARALGFVDSSGHKRHLPDIPKLGLKTLGIDWDI